MDIKSGLFWNTLQQVGQLGFAFLSTVILSRLLSPDDYGLYGIIMIFINISGMLSDSGIGGYIIKKKDISPIYYNTLFVYNLGISIILYIILFFSAPLVGHIYDNTSIIGAIRLVGVVIILYAFSITQYSRLLKEMRFKQLAIIALISGFIAFVVAILLAKIGYGFWALIWQQIVMVGLSTILYVCVTRNIPSIQFEFIVFKEEFRFGSYLFVSSLFKTITDNISNNFIGKIFTLKEAGFFVQANRLQSYPNSMVTNVVDRTFFPIFSKMNNETNELAIRVAKLRLLVYSLLFPLFAFIIVFGGNIVTLVLGSNWADCIQYFRILMFASFPMLIKAMNRNVLKSTGYTKQIFLIECCSTIFLLLSLGVAFLANSMIVVLLCVVATQYLSAYLSIVMTSKILKESISKQILEIVKYLPITFIPILLSLLDFKNSNLGNLLAVISFIIMILIYCINDNSEYRQLLRVLLNRKIK